MTMLIMTACKEKPQNTNPFFAAWDTPFEVPPFDRIDTTHFLPAFEEAMKQQAEEINVITGNTEAPDFQNTVLAFDKSGKMLSRVSRVFFNLLSANTNQQMQDLAKKISPALARHGDDIYLNAILFGRIKSVYDNRLSGGLDDQQIRATEKHYNDFIRRGAGLSPEDQERLRVINQELSSLSLKYGDNVLAETNQNFQLVVEQESDLAGLPQTSIDAAAEAAAKQGLNGKWVFTLSKPSLIPFLQYAENRSLREKIYKGYYMRGDNNNAHDNKGIITETVKLRAEKAHLLGYDSWAAYIIADNMAKTPAAVDEFLMKLWNGALPVAKSEASRMQAMIDADGGKFKLASWDWWYYAEKIRKAEFDLDENELKPYFSLENVRDGMFMVAGKLYGITLEKRSDLPVYHPEVETFEVKEADGSHLGVLYMDYHPRAEKRGGAWCTHFRSAGWENDKRIAPVVSIVCNFTAPTANTPALLNWDETLTLFHEFGHALHGLFTTGKYTRTAGSVARDFVELPSQILENWAADPVVLKMYARHWQTGEAIPDELIGKIVNSGHFNQGFETGEYLAAAILDMEYHKLPFGPASENVEPNAFEQAAMKKIGLIDEIIPRYRSTYFQHIFSGGYSAGYYVYIWAAVLDADAFDAFKQSGDLFNPELAARFRQYCLSENGNDDGMVQYRKFRGQEPSIEPLLKKRGLK